MKRLLIYVLIALMAFTPIADADGETGGHRIYASAAPTVALTEGLLRSADGFSVHQLVQPQLDCIRLYELSDWDIVQLSSAEVCIIWGKLESFSDTLTQAETGPAVIAIADDNAEYTLSDELVDYDYYEHFSGENPNSYMSLSHMKIALDSLYHSLCELYPDSAETFTVNYERMVKLMDEASLQLTGLNDGIKHEAVAALFEGAPYILDEIGIEWQYIYPRELASDINGEDLTEMLELLNESGVQAVLIEQQAPTTLKRALSDAGYTVRQVSTLTTLNKPTLEEYIDVIVSNAHAAIG